MLDKAKEKVINHLSHELKTPLVILSGVLDTVRKAALNSGDQTLTRALDRGHRNVRRLMDLQLKIDDILQQRPVDDAKKILSVMETAVDLLGDLGAKGRADQTEILTLVSERLEELFGTVRADQEWVDVTRLVDDVCDRAAAELGNRPLEIARDVEGGLQVFLDMDALRKACEGILRNAIENTPDHGAIEVSARKEQEVVKIEIRDYGVGITAENQQLIFGGFFHTQNTEAYSSKRPYRFNAGGSGTDLLRIKCLAERYGFSVDFDSVRCRYIPGDDDACPGSVPGCGFIKTPSDCRSSGGSRFSIAIPPPPPGTRAAGLGPAPQP